MLTDNDDDKHKNKLSNNKVIAKAISDAEKELADKGRVLLRPSGTEPVVRVMVEGEDELQVKSLVDKLAVIVRAELA